MRTIIISGILVVVGTLFTPLALANVQEKVVGHIDFGDVVRTVDVDQHNVCYSVQGNGNDSGVAISCVSRQGLKKMASVKVGIVYFGEIKRIWDEDTKVVCYVVQNNEPNASVAITCK